MMVFFIQNERNWEASKMKSMPAESGMDVRYINPCTRSYSLSAISMSIFFMVLPVVLLMKRSSPSFLNRLSGFFCAAGDADFSCSVPDRFRFDFATRRYPTAKTATSESIANKILLLRAGAVDGRALCWPGFLLLVFFFVICCSPGKLPPESRFETFGKDAEHQRKRTIRFWLCKLPAAALIKYTPELKFATSTINLSENG